MKIADHIPQLPPSPRGAQLGRRLRPSSVAAGRDAWEEDMGRQAAPNPAAFTGLVSLRRIRLNSGGYDQGGAYWGHGQPLYSALSQCGTLDQISRFPDRDAARAWVLGIAPGAKVRA